MAFHDDGLLDEIGWNILRELQQEARLSFHELGRRVGLSAPAVAERVRKMEDAGIILGYGAKVNPQKVGLPITAVIRITTLKMPLPQGTDLVSAFPELLECHRVTGTDSYHLKVIVSSVSHLEQVVNRLVPYGEPATSIVLSSLISGESVKQEAWWNGKEPTAQT
ncbi:Lrp/AsnC family transcriptional regulator [Ktedonospora formicarum]|uniref:AsnC family transcriptional regulator n=1 Tax=Ktedonospora formicarum TaxID=2778364 RepID=A0A8J3I3V5_9CHLR|nr:Lrp/AsnC family transcriptional regulator [Ktedonospora formicarum]GHO47071.1 AsnC family transcriptional regulator [Ktedonospora formicarum]